MNRSLHLARVIATAGLTSAILLAAFPARAQEPPRADGSKPQTTSIAPLGSSLTGPAKTEYESARNLFEISDFAGALLKFKHAFELSSEPRLLWNMAACEKEMHHYGNAVLDVDRFLREGGAAISAESRDNAAATLTALRGLTSPLTLTGVPDGALIFVDGEQAGTTPLAAPLVLDLGAHKIRVEHADLEPSEQMIEGVTGGTALVVAITMAPLTAAHLTVLASAGDTIALDGKVVGSERWESRVAPGLHKLHVTAVGKTPYDAELQLQPRGSRSVQVTLIAESKRAVWPWIAGGAALVAGATLGGYFLFKPRDEPGSYTSGGLGTVILPSGVRFR